VPGYWGPPTATVDWCEANYVCSHYVCEWFNTVSSVAMVIVGAAGAWIHWRVLERRFVLAYLAVTIVGIGSIAFHATLRRELQMLDELPMLYSALILVYILLENRPRRRFGAWLPALLVGHGVLVTALSTATRGALQFYLFHLSFGSLELFALLRVALIARRNQSPVVRRLFWLGTCIYVSAVALWLTDLKVCHFLSITLPSWGLFNPQLLYLLTLLIAHDRLQVLGQRPQLHWRPWPRLTIQ
jgi:dihydroceramidase